MSIDVEKGLIEVKIPRSFGIEILVTRNQIYKTSFHLFVIQFNSVKSGYGFLQKGEILSGNPCNLRYR